MNRETSNDAYRMLVETKKLVGKQQQIIEVLIVMERATSGEVLDSLGVHNVNAWRARFTELQARGLIRECGERKCAVTGRRCLVWMFTDRTKPLNAKKGHRIDGKAWRKLAAEAIVSIDDPQARERFKDRARQLGGAV